MTKPRLSVVPDVVTEITVTADDIIAEYPTARDEFVDDVVGAVDEFMARLEKIKKRHTGGQRMTRKECEMEIAHYILAWEDTYALFPTNTLYAGPCPCTSDCCDDPECYLRECRNCGASCRCAE